MTSGVLAGAVGVGVGYLVAGLTGPAGAPVVAVASLVIEAGGDEEQAMAGVLHDAIEDVGVEQEAEIARRFGPRVARIVRACTDADSFPKPPWRERKEAYLRHLRETESDVLIVSCADKLHNARAIVTDLRTHGTGMFARFNAGRDGTLWYYAALAEVFAEMMPGPTSRDLSLAVAEMHALAE